MSVDSDNIIAVLIPENIKVIVEDPPDVTVEIDPSNEILVLSSPNVGPTGAQGEKGLSGIPGEQWFSGVGAPSDAMGVSGDWYINSTNGDYYEKLPSLLDNFNRPDENPIGTNWHQWVTDPALKLVSNQLAGATPDFGSAIFNSSMPADVEAYIEFANVPSGWVGVYARLDPEFTGLGWNVWYEPTSTSVMLYYGANELVGSKIIPALGIGDGLGIRCQGSSIQLWVLDGGIWSQVISVNDSRLPGTEHNNKLLIYIDGTATRLDNFRGGGIPSLGNWILRGSFKGPTGATGSQGVPGTPGEKWFTGTGAPAGALAGSIVGDWYVDSANGDYYEKTGTSAWTLRGNLKGPIGNTGSQGIQGVQGNTGATGSQGPSGTPGEKWFTGTGAPAGALAGSIVGDWYLDSVNGDYYEKTGASAWTLRGNLKGLTGSTGPQGPPGTVPASTGTRVYRSTTQTVGAAANVPISFDTERYDANDSWVIGSPTRLTIKAAGIYTITGSITYPGSSSGRKRLARLRLNGAVILAEGGVTASAFNASDQVVADVACTVQLAVNDYIELCAWQDSGGNLICVASDGTNVRAGLELSIALSSGVGIPAGGATGAPLVKSSATDYAAIWNPAMTIDPATGKIIWTDVNIYRDIADNLRTDNYFRVGKGIVAGISGTDPSLYFGSALDAKLYRSAAGVLRTDGQFICNAKAGFVPGLVVGGGGVGVAEHLVQLKKDLANYPVLVLDATGALLFGAGDAVTNTDTTLSRTAANQLNVSGSFKISSFVQIGGPINVFHSSYGTAFTTAVGSDTQYRFQIDDNGKMQWGTGSAAADCNLYRYFAGNLKTDGGLYASSFAAVGGSLGLYYNPVAAGGYVVQSIKQGDANPWFAIQYDGLTQWGPGGATVPDTNLYRYAADVLRTDDLFSISRTSELDLAVGIKKAAEALYRMRIYAGGNIEWGNGATGFDTNLYRSAADQLKTDDSFWIVGTFGLGDAPSLMTKVTGRQVEVSNGICIIATGYGLGIGVPAATSPPANGIVFGTPADTNLYRNGVDRLQTDDSFVVGGNLILVNELYRSNALFFINNGGGLDWGPGDWSRDVNLYRPAANTLKTDHSLLVVKNLGVGVAPAFGSGVGVFGIANAATVPTTNPTGGVAVYAEAGKLKWRQADGVIVDPGAGVITAGESVLGADITMTLASTYYDAVSVVLTPGTYLLDAHVTIFESGGTPNGDVKLWNGTTIEASAVINGEPDFGETTSLTGLIVVTGTETWKITVKVNTASALIKATVPTTTNPGATRLRWIKIA